MTTVAVVRCPTYERPVVEQAVHTGIELVGGLTPLVSFGDTVLLKPNLLEIRDGESGATTDRRLVGALAEMVTARGASAIVGDSPGLRHRGAGEEVLQATGMRAHCEAVGARVMSFDATPSVEVSVPGGQALRQTLVATAALESDLVVSIPKLKTHALTVVTMAVKNLYGVLPGGQKTLGHALGPTPERFADVILDVYGLVRPGLGVMDAVVGMAGTWRTERDRIAPGLILVSTDCVALDAVACGLAGIAPLDVPMLRRAHERGLGTADLSAIEVVGDGAHARIHGLRLPGPRRFVWPLLRAFSGPLSREDPRVSPELCDGCGTCLDACPAKAIRFADGVARVDLDACSRCFCCHELCPQRAVTIERGWLGRRLFG